MSKCYQCKYRGTIPGDAHSCCHHPAVLEQISDPLLSIVAIFASAGRANPVMLDKLNIKGNLHGIENGWFNWPWNFDPVWLENCDGFVSRDQE